MYVPSKYPSLQNYSMTAELLLTSDLPVLTAVDTVKCALDLMDEYKVGHLPLVVEDQFKEPL